MALETGDHIAALDPNNPLGSDPKSEGDDHIRLLKRATQGSFPAFVGTIAVPKSVTLTEDQINDAAQKSAAQRITGVWIWENDVGLNGRNAADDSDFNFIKVTSADLVLLGDALADAELRGLSNIDLAIGGVLSAAIVSLALGGLLVSDLGGTGKKAGFRNPTNETFSTNQTPDQTWEGTNRQCTGSSPTVTIDQLEAFTAFRIMTTGSGITIARGDVTNLRWLDGSGNLNAITSALIARGSVVEVYYQSATTAYIFGNGITEI